MQVDSIGTQHYTCTEWEEKQEKDRPVNDSFWKEQSVGATIRSNFVHIPKEKWLFPENVREIILKKDSLEFVLQSWETKTYELPIKEFLIGKKSPWGTVEIKINNENSYIIEENSLGPLVNFVKETCADCSTPDN